MREEASRAQTGQLAVPAALLAALAARVEQLQLVAVRAELVARRPTAAALELLTLSEEALAQQGEAGAALLRHQTCRPAPTSSPAQPSHHHRHLRPPHRRLERRALRSS